MKIVSKFIDTTILGFTFLCKLISRGFYFLISIPILILSKIFYRNSKIRNIKNHYKIRQEQPIAFLLTSFIFIFMATSIIMINDKKSLNPNKNISPFGNSKVEERIESETEQSNNTSNPGKTNIFVKYSSMKFEEVNITDIKQVNQDVIAWLNVDGTNINYPILQTDNNDYYLEYNIEHNKTTDGWPFMDYRNSKMMSDNNTIFYGHNLFNGTNFGTISNIFTKDWFKNSNHLITIKTESKIYTYEIFSYYETGDEVDYLQNLFFSNEEYQEFLNMIKNKSKRDFKVEVTYNDNIITLSTCNDDNTGRKVVHAKFISSEFI